MPLVFAMLGTGAVLASIDPADCFPNSLEGPGVTLDESFNVQMGVYLMRAVSEYGLAVLHPASLAEVFGDPGYNPDHPPFGRLWLGLFHEICRLIGPSADVPSPYITAYGRVGSALAFGATIFLIGLFCSVHFGRVAGAAASASLILMPRLFGHAHLASLETVLNLTWTACLVGTAHFWSRQPVPSRRAALATGLLLGLALLTKMQAVLLPPLVAGWALWHWRHRAFVPLGIWCLAGAVTFLVGWPWLWLNFPDNVLAYFERGAHRVPLHCAYLGATYNDVDVPWHYPWIMAVVTVPSGLLVLGTVALLKLRARLLRDQQLSLLVGAAIAPLVLFSLNVAVYDGARLFLVSFPVFAMFAGIGTQYVLEWLRPKCPHAALIVAALVAGQATGVLWFKPYWLSYYNVLVGGLAGAHQLGFEINYWGDGCSRTFLDKVVRVVPPRSRVAVIPVMHQFQLLELTRQAPLIRRHGIILVPEETERREARFLISFARQADLPARTELEARGWRAIADVRRQGVPMAVLWVRE